jgi:TrmH family RNA methyltransferase
MGLTEAAKKTAKGAPKLLESIRYFDTLSSAIADCHFALGFTRRIREPAQQFQNIQEMVAEWNQANTEPTKTALVFGRESQGLSREESLLVSHLVCIPMMDENLSLNLSHAVAIALYAFLGSTLPDALSMDSKSTRNAHLPIQQENNAVLDHLLQTLDAKGFFRSGKESAHRDYTRVLWQRLRPTRQELDFLAGMLKRLSVPS